MEPLNEKVDLSNETYMWERLQQDFEYKYASTISSSHSSGQISVKEDQSFEWFMSFSALIELPSS